MLAAGAAFLLTAGVAAYTAYNRYATAAAPEAATTTQTADKKKNVPAAQPEEEKKEEVPQAAAAAAPASVSADDTNWLGFTDPAFDTNHYLTKDEAVSRSKLVSDVNYVLVLGLLKGGKTFNG